MDNPIQTNRRRTEMSELRRLLALGRVLAMLAQQSNDETLAELGAAWDRELMRLHSNQPIQPSREN
ncbi:hypothetical protein SFMTTN_2056 [Sulfuriferula multivorans]|uniref:Uncharacterized protein n=1 Tax=Sulfuriferula multivorans TaxID=1559896 RepID=A0A401JF62_9PROT|nr:hypothetical protein [Sulfuriferula multivorans]GBL46243.1 hypothetical protein SFMTTN_2056 [Sulfuriferula multivorans]